MAEVTKQGVVQASGLTVGARTMRRITVCSYTGFADTNGSWSYHARQAGDCDNGPPSGNCMGFLSKGNSDFGNEDGRVALPGESISGTGFAYGGMHFW